MDAVTLGMAKADARKRYARGQSRAVWLGDSLTGNGSTPTSVVGTVAASAVGATSLTFTSASASRPSPTAPAVGNVIVLEPGTVREEYVRISAVTGTGPYTLTVAALTYAHGAGSAVRTEPRWFTAQSVPWWVTLLSSNRVKFGGVYAHGGYTAADVQAIYLPQVLALSPKPQMCFVNVGRNDVYSAGSLTTYTQILDSLIGAGITPVVMSAPPDSGIGVTIPHTWNLALQRECRNRGVPFIDVFSALVDTGTGTAGAGKFLLGLNLDNTHPSEAGAKAWAQAIVTSLAQWFDLQVDTLSAKHNSYNGDTASYPVNSNNAVLLTDTNADGVPDNWTKTAGNGTDTLALVTRAGVPGKLMSITRVAAGATDPIVQSNTFTIVPGNKYRAYLWIETTGVDAAYVAQQTSTTAGTTSAFSGFDVRLTDNPAGADDALFTMKTWKRDVPLSLVSFDFTAPAGLTSNTIQWLIRLRGSAAAPAYTLVVQPFLVNLTAAGAA